MERRIGRFVWDVERELVNIAKHGVDFTTAARVFLDTKRKIFTDSQHSIKEPRYFCIGKLGDKIITVRFTYRDGLIRIFASRVLEKGEDIL